MPLEKHPGEPGGNFGFNPFFVKIAKLCAQVGNFVQARELETFERTLRTGHQVLKRRLGAAHEWPPNNKFIYINGQIIYLNSTRTKYRTAGRVLEENL
jgi:hypothetical protein